MKRLLLVALGALFTYVPGVTIAAEMEEIVVTATRREESIQDVPIAVSAFTGDDLAKRGVQDLYGLQEVAPSIAVYSSNSTSNGGTLRIRGVGTTGNNPGLEAAVGTFIDGVYRSRAGLAFNDMVDIERVEVLRGPQGTLFGKNTVAGALNIVTKRPEFSNSASITLGAANLAGRSFKGHVNGSNSETVAFRLAGSWQERDGFYNNIDTGEDYDDRDRYTLKGQILWLPADDVSVRVIADYTEKDETCCPAAYYINGPTGAIVEGLGGSTTTFQKDSTLDVGVNHDPFEEVEDEGVSVEIEWDINEDVTFKSVTSFRRWDVFRGQDIDFGNADVLLPQDSSETFENFSQEFQILGTRGNLDWLAGAYIYTEDLESDEMIVLGTQGPQYVSRLITGADVLAEFFEGNPAGRFNSTGVVPNQGYDAAYSSETEGWSIFTHNTWHLNDHTDFTVGVRYSDEEKQATSIINGAAPWSTPVDDPFCAAVPIASLCDNSSYNNSESENETTGTLKLAYQLTDNVNTYISYSRGYKAGGYNLDQEAVGNRDANGNFVDESRFNPETSDSWELGLKGNFMDANLTLNAALFYTDFDQFQLNTFTGLGFTVGNIPAVRTEGIEIEGLYQISGSAFVSFGATYADARYVKVAAGDAHLEDQRLTQSPLWQGTASLFLEDTLPNSNWSYSFNLNFSHVGQANTGSDLDPEKIRGAFNMINTSFNLLSGDGKWGVGLWGRNLGDTQRQQLVFDSVFQAGSWSTFGNIGRTFGLTVTANIGG